MAAERALGRRRVGRLPPAGEPLLASLLRGRALRADAGSLATEISRRLGGGQVQLRVSGREALRVVLATIARRNGRDEVIVPAYTCFSVPSAVVAAGLRVRLVDVDAAGRIDLEDLQKCPLERAAAVLVCNLFGNPEPVAPVRELASRAGAATLDDVAQCLGASDAQGVAGSRGDAAILSFGRGKPLSALGGGALAWFGREPAPASPEPPAASTFGAALRALAHDVALRPWVFGVLSAIPPLEIGTSRFDPTFQRGPIGAAALALLASGLARFERDTEARIRRGRELSQLVAERTSFRPIEPLPGTRGVYPRLALRAPSPTARENAARALARLGAGASGLYPTALDAIPALRSHLVEPRSCPGAAELAARLLTLPTHGRLRGERLEEAIRALTRATG